MSNAETLRMKTSNEHSPNSRRRWSLGSVMESQTAAKSIFASFLTFQFLCNSRSSHGSFLASFNNFSSSDISHLQSIDSPGNYNLPISSTFTQSCRERERLFPFKFSLFSFSCRVPARERSQNDKTRV